MRVTPYYSRSNRLNTKLSFLYFIFILDKKRKTKKNLAGVVSNSVTPPPISHFSIIYAPFIHAAFACLWRIFIFNYISNMRLPTTHQTQPKNKTTAKASLIVCGNCSYTWFIVRCGIQIKMVWLFTKFHKTIIHMYGNAAIASTKAKHTHKNAKQVEEVFLWP